MMDVLSKSPLNEIMSCGVMSNGSGQVIIFHDRPIEEEISWIEYDQSSNSFSIVYVDGFTQSLGFEINSKTAMNLMNSGQVVLAYLEGKQIMSTQEVVIIAKDY
tara:strand:- start:710 stop:1021 length:312 start_codon:yes stop_codon:yes gene_type:complete